MATLIHDTFTGAVGPLSAHVGEAGTPWIDTGDPTYDFANGVAGWTLNGAGETSVTLGYAAIKPSVPVLPATFIFEMDIRCNYAGTSRDIVVEFRGGEEGEVRAGNEYELTLDFFNAGAGLKIFWGTDDFDTGTFSGSVAYVNNSVVTIRAEISDTDKKIFIGGVQVHNFTGNVHPAGGTIQIISEQLIFVSRVLVTGDALPTEFWTAYVGTEETLS